MMKFIQLMDYIKKIFVEKNMHSDLFDALSQELLRCLHFEF